MRMIVPRIWGHFFLLNLISFLYLFGIFALSAIGLYFTKGPLFFFYILSICICSDIGGYVVGKKIGGIIAPNFAIGAVLMMKFAAEAAKSTADHLQDVSVTIRSEAGWSAGEGSGVIFSRKDKDGNTVNFVWTAAHVIDNLRSERKVIVNGAPRTVVTFKDAKIVKVIRQGGRAVGQLELDAEVIKYSDSE